MLNTPVIGEVERNMDLAVTIKMHLVTCSFHLKLRIGVMDNFGVFADDVTVICVDDEDPSFIISIIKILSKYAGIDC